MSVDISGGFYIGMAKPHLYRLDIPAHIVQHTCCAVPQVVESHRFQIMRFKHALKRARQTIRAKRFAVLPDENIVRLVILTTEQPAVFRLFVPQFQKYLANRRDKLERRCAVLGFRLRK